MTRTRGRPQKFDEQAAIQAATNVFWKNGFSATSLDDLATAMEMNRPSIYRAFGDKETLYRRTLQEFADGMNTAMQHSLFAEPDIKKALLSFYQQALNIYVTEAQSRGCLIMGTAVSAATSHPNVQADLLHVIQKIAKSFAKRFKQAERDQQLSENLEINARVDIAQSILHSLSLRARAGDSKAALNKLIKSGVQGATL